MTGRHELAVAAHGVGLRAGDRDVFSGVDVEAPVGSFVVLTGGSGSGKTALLLALAGRLRTTSGRLTVLGHELPAQAGAVRRRTGLGEVRGVNDLEDALTVEQHVAERLVLHQPWWRPWASRAQVAEQLDRVDRVLDSTADAGAPVPRLRPREFVSDVDPLERMALGVVLALVGRPEVLLVDDVDSLRRSDERVRAWLALSALRHTAPHPVTVVATCSDTLDVPVGIDPLVVDLDRHRDPARNPDLDRDHDEDHDLNHDHAAAPEVTASQEAAAGAVTDPERTT